MPGNFSNASSRKPPQGIMLFIKLESIFILALYARSVKKKYQRPGKAVTAVVGSAT
jgi:hypothetical protein